MPNHGIFLRKMIIFLWVLVPNANMEDIYAYLISFKELTSSFHAKKCVFVCIVIFLNQARNIEKLGLPFSRCDAKIQTKTDYRNRKYVSDRVLIENICTMSVF